MTAAFFVIQARGAQPTALAKQLQQENPGCRVAARADSSQHGFLRSYRCTAADIAFFRRVRFSERSMFDTRRFDSRLAQFNEAATRPAGVDPAKIVGARQAVRSERSGKIERPATF